MKKSVKNLIVAVIIPLGAGVLSGLLSRSSVGEFESAVKPPLYPPEWLFPVVWTVLYILMGVASYLVYTSDSAESKVNCGLSLYFTQLALNFFWPIIFFVLSAYLFSFIWLVIMWVLIVFTTVCFFRVRPLAGFLMIPYLAWVTFAGYLNLAVYIVS